MLVYKYISSQKSYCFHSALARLQCAHSVPSILVLAPVLTAPYPVPRTYSSVLDFWCAFIRNTRDDVAAEHEELIFAVPHPVYQSQVCWNFIQQAKFDC